MSTIRDTDLIRTNDYAEDSGEVRVLDPEGRLLPGATEPDLSDEALVTMYEAMVTARRFDERAVSWQRQGRLATYAPMSGQEAGQVASTLALADDDWVFPTYREHAVRLVAGFDLPEILRGLMGAELPVGSAGGPTVAPEAIPIATQIPHATGAAMAARHRGDESVALSHFGDGATSEGDFHEALNFAGVFDAPAVYLCHNNQWAISVPRARQTASATLAQKADAYGFEGIRVDGMDPLAVYSVVRYAREKALDPDAEDLRPTLIESVEYRYGAHTTADDPDVYRDEEEVDYWRERDPIDRLETFLVETGRLDEGAVEAIGTRVDERVAEAIEAAEAEAAPDPDDLFEDVYDEVPEHLADQREELRRLRERHGDALLRD
ncbi:pyruvate dehydrogenase (acetyl-transferring) E1 component subunit alpha [Halosimplex pelagicum]|uniref:Pyruvate dehydrogenase (Acetyl-transferring) E1 component subunit alpha n=1 Tax=Halosimplex pelagicum TaxID=869886 RepID=A0A7D5TUS9_9EURY|nr:pyruvate dehydrogenase (acetyl-transferring) E1 component subunit alpha [Halosimplex pelagicum]QLH82634.1 pyruvate dehydrogenase (acetyl-transferring) E1 component subunit alpha [Halosimplex pelagicum]